MGDRIFVTIKRWINKAKGCNRRDDTEGYDRWMAWAFALLKQWDCNRDRVRHARVP